MDLSLAVGISEVIANVIFEFGFLGKGLIERRSYTLRIHMCKCKAGNRKGGPVGSCEIPMSERRHYNRGQSYQGADNQRPATHPRIRTGQTPNTESGMGKS